MSLILQELLPDFNFRIDEPADGASGRGYLDLFINDVLQPALDEACSEALRWIDQQDIDTANSQTINAILMDLGNPFDVAYELPLNRRRLLARVLIDVYKTKGTAGGMEDVVFALAEVVVTVVAPATVDSFDLGRDVLAEDEGSPDPDLTDPTSTNFGYLGVNPTFSAYSFQVEVPRVLTDEEKSIIREIVLLMKPAHTHFVGFIEPTGVQVVEHVELGLSALHASGEPVVGDEVVLHGFDYSLASDEGYGEGEYGEGGYGD